MGLGIAVSLGSWITAGLATGAVAGAIGGAIIGAAIGGLTAAVTGGSIGKGMLFGAVGGAVAGGISGAFGGGGATAQGLAKAQQAANMGVNTGSQLALAEGTYGVASTGATSISAGLSEVGVQVAGKAVASGIGGYMESEANKDTLAAQEKAATIAHERNKETMKLASELSTSGGGGDGAELAYKARMAELSQRKTEFDTQTSQTRLEWDTEMERRKGRRALLSGDAAEDLTVQAPAVAGESILEKRQENVQVDPTAPETALGGV